VAIKTVKLADADDEETAEALARFKREAQAAGRLSHPNIVGVYDYGETDELAYIVMEFVEGRSLKSLLDQEKRLPPDEACTIMQQVLAGLGYSHARGVVHRDIKPANIMLTSEGQVKIADFGIARIESSSMTSVGTVMGTPAYMPPEQFLGEAVDARSDIYAAGVMLFHLLTGERPYEGNMTTIMQKVLSLEPAPPASARAAGLPAVFDGVIAGAMAKAPANRYPSAGAFAQALRTAFEAASAEPEADATIVAPSPRARPAAEAELTATPRAAPVQVPPALAPPLPKLRQTKRAFPWALAAGMAAVVVASAAGTWFVLRPKAPEPSAPPVPATPAPAPVLSAEQMRDRVATAIGDIACTDLAISSGTAGAIAVSGYAGEGTPQQSARTAADAAAGSPVDWSVRSLDTGYCTALDIVRLASQPGADGVSKTLDLSLNGSHGWASLHDGDPIVPAVVTPSYPAWVSMDYLSAVQGALQHLVPGAADFDRLRAPGETIALKAEQTGCVSPPFGTDMIISVAAAQPLLTAPRPANESNPRDYLETLRQAVSAARANGEQTSAALVAVETSPAAATGEQRAVVTTAGLALHASPRDNAPVRARLAMCEPLTAGQRVKSGTQAWVQVNAAQGAGWVQAGGLQFLTAGAAP
jgi:serine/threonine-protein kinase